MSAPLPKPPSADQYKNDPDATFRALTDFLYRLAERLESVSRTVETPAKAAFSVTNISAPTTTLDGATAVDADVINFLGGLYATLLAKGIIRTKAGDP